MGRIEKLYCDTCGGELENALYKIKVQDGTANTTDLDICGTCYGIFTDYFKKLKDSALSNWTPKKPPINEPAPK